MKKQVFIFFSIFLIFCVQKIFSQNVEILAVEDKSAKISQVNGKNVVSKSSKSGIEVSLIASRDKKTSSLICAVKIKNYSLQDFNFKEENLLVYEGNYETDEWQEKQYLSASKLYAKRKAELYKDLNLNYFYPNYDFYDYDFDFNKPTPLPSQKYSKRSPKNPLDEDYEFYKGMSPYKKSETHSSPLDPILETLEFFDFLDSLSTDDELEFLKESLLFSKKISSGETYSGIILIDEGKKPDYKISLKISDLTDFNNSDDFSDSANKTFSGETLSQSEELESKSAENFLENSDKNLSQGKQEILDFKFTKTNREDILHPFRDRNYGRHAFTFALTLPHERWGIYYIYAGKIIGAYGGLSFPFGSNYSECFGTALNNDSSLSTVEFDSDIDSSYFYKTSPTGNSTYEMSGFCAGLTVKTIPHTWLMIGCSLDIRQDYYEGYVYYKDKDSSSEDFTYWTNAWFRAENTQLYFSPQLGVNVIFDFIDISGIFEWRINSGPKFELMFGFAI